MIRIVKNRTQSDMNINDLGAVLVEASSQIDLAELFTASQLAKSTDLFSLLVTNIDASGYGDLILNDGTNDLVSTVAVDVIRGHNPLVSNPRNKDGKLVLAATPRPYGTATIFVSRGDDTTDHKNIGGGEWLRIIHPASGDESGDLYIDFNVMQNETHIHEVYLDHFNCQGASLSANIVPKTTTYTSGSNTNYNLVNGVIVPASGDGTIDLTETPNLVGVTTNQAGVQSPGYWNADYDPDTSTFSNITASPTGEGAYNIFGTEIILQRLIMDLVLCSKSTSESKHVYLQTSEEGELKHNFRLKVSWAIATGQNVEFGITGIVVLYRKYVGQSVP